MTLEELYKDLGIKPKVTTHTHKKRVHESQKEIVDSDSCNVVYIANRYHMSQRSIFRKVDAYIKKMHVARSSVKKNKFMFFTKKIESIFGSDPQDEKTNKANSHASFDDLIAALNRVADILEFKLTDPIAAKDNSKKTDLLSKNWCDVFNFSVRASNCLYNADINTVGQIVSCTADRLMRIRNIGKTTLREIRNVLKQHGLHLMGETNHDDVDEVLPGFHKTIKDTLSGESK